MTWIETIIIHWKDFTLVTAPILTWFLTKKSRDTKDKTNEATLADVVQGVYTKMAASLETRIDYLEKANEDLTKKYSEMLLRNAILEERAESYEEKYKTLEKDYSKLKSDHDKLHKENKEIRRELDEIKNNTA